MALSVAVKCLAICNKINTIFDNIMAALITINIISFLYGNNLQPIKRIIILKYQCLEVIYLAYIS